MLPIGQSRDLTGNQGNANSLCRVVPAAASRAMTDQKEGVREREILSYVRAANGPGLTSASAASPRLELPHVDPPTSFTPMYFRGVLNA